jgi:hypothetical protein
VHKGRAHGDAREQVGLPELAPHAAVALPVQAAPEVRAAGAARPEGGLHRQPQQRQQQ